MTRPPARPPRGPDVPVVYRCYACSWETYSQNPLGDILCDRCFYNGERRIMACRLATPVDKPPEKM